MADKVQLVDYFYAKVANKPGEGYNLLEQFSKRGVNLMAFTAFPVGEGKAQMDLIPESAKQLHEVADNANIDLIGPKKAFLIQGEDKIGALNEHHLKLASAGVNIRAGNAVCDGSGKFGYVFWVEPEDFEKAAEALGI